MQALEGLLKEHSQDILLLRYKAICLNRLGRYAEAIALFQDILQKNPNHTPSHFYLAEAYWRSENLEAAKKEWAWVVERSEYAAYHTWALEALAGQEKNTENVASEKSEIPRWFYSGRYGYEYDSNVVLAPDDKSIASVGDKNAGRQVFDLTLRYRAYADRHQVVDVYYALRQTIHDDSLDEFNFHSEEFGLNYKRRVQIGNQDVVLGLRYDLLLGFLHDDLFSVRNRWGYSADTRFTSYTRTVLYGRSTVSNFARDGFSPDRVSRDGFYQDFGITHYFYSKDFQKHIYLKQEINTSMARGNNFDRFGTTSRIGLHTPLAEKIDFDTSVGVLLGFYPNFSSTTDQDSARRRDRSWDVYTALTYRFRPNIGLRTFYSYTHAWNQNNVFDYSRHVAGAQIIYSGQL